MIWNAKSTNKRNRKMEIYVVQFLKNQRSIVCLQLISVIISFASTNVAAQTNEPTLSRTNVEELSILESGPADNTTTAGKSNDNIADSVVFQAPGTHPIVSLPLHFKTMFFSTETSAIPTAQG